MQELHRYYNKLNDAFKAAAKAIRLTERIQQLSQLKQTSQAPDFWQDSSRAQAQMQELSRLQSMTQPWEALQNELQEVGELLELNDDALENDLKAHITEIEQRLTALKGQLKFTGKFDDHAAILTISAGAGGTDAQDWTQMLLRMYARWAEENKYKTTLIEESAGEEAGLKRVVLEVDGDFAYGKLKGEHGVHRLVRLSPFNSDNLRQTSFAKVEVLPKVAQENEVEIDPADLKIDVFRAGGHGGQSVNTTDSAVRVTHLPTGLVVSIQNERSQLQNKETAMTILRSKLAQLQLEQHKEKISELKGPNQSAEWGNQIRSYVLHPYKQVKDLRTKYETSNAEAVLDGDLNALIDAYLEHTITGSH